ncbi:MAG: SpoIIE family protein phosphatase [Phycisphaeraceae bacterium]|nr:MAG: SpoIIE family protein phosphatase [Phycisphaeraceae bacterium]
MPHPALPSDALRRVLEVSRRLGVTADLGEVLSLIIDAMRDLLNADRATVFEHDAVRGELFATVAHGLATGGGAVRFPISEGLAGAAATSGTTINVREAYDDPRFNAEVDRRTGYRTHSILSIPLHSFDAELVGVAQVLNKRGGAFGAEDVLLAEALAAQAAVAIKRARLVEEALQRRRLERELELAREIQQRTLPRTLPVLPGFELAVWSEPADQTGGDTFDVIPLSRAGRNGDPHTPVEQVMLVLADATGHGVGPSLMVAEMRALLRMGVRLAAPWPVLIDHLNRQLLSDTPVGRFVTAWFGLLDAPKATLRTFSAGQAPLLWYHAHADSVEVLGADAMPLGIGRELGPCEGSTIRLKPGDIFAAISDGIIEAEGGTEHPFGIERTCDVIRASHRLGAEGVVRAINEALAAFTGGAPASDDRTMVIVRCVP